MRLGQEFSGYARQVEAARERVEAALPGMCELALGGTAVGTGLNAPPGFAAAVIAELAARTGLPLREASNHFEAQGARDAAAFLSAALRNYALALIKIANDIRWLGSGPRCGIGELQLPATQPGSSIMPGKVNPVIAESLLMVCAQVIGHDAAIAWCAAAGNFELNVMMPVMAWDLLDSIELLAAATRNFETRWWTGWKPTGSAPRRSSSSRWPWPPRWLRSSATSRPPRWRRRRTPAAARSGRSPASRAGFPRSGWRRIARSRARQV